MPSSPRRVRAVELMLVDALGAAGILGTLWQVLSSGDMPSVLGLPQVVAHCLEGDEGDDEDDTEEGTNSAAGKMQAKVRGCHVLHL